MAIFSDTLQPIIDNLLKEYEKVKCMEDFKAINAYVQSKVEERLHGNFFNLTFIEKGKEDKRKEKDEQSRNGLSRTQNPGNNTYYNDIRNILIGAFSANGAENE
jgi:hypothetical protein